MRNALLLGAALACVTAVVTSASDPAATGPGLALEGKRLFEQATFGGNGRTCVTCHSAATGTVSPQDAQKRFLQDPNDPLFLHDGSDDGLGNGATRMLADATVLINVPLGPGVQLADDVHATTVLLRRGIPTTLNTPALDDVLMLDGRKTSLEEQAAGAIIDHAQGVVPSVAQLHAIADFERTGAFFSSPAIRRFALEKGPAPGLPEGRSESEKRGQRFFKDVRPDPDQGLKPGLCAHCHSGPLLNQTNEFAAAFIRAPIPAGQRFISVGVSESPAAQSTAREFIFHADTPNPVHISSPDPGRALITGIIDDPQLANLNAFKISALRGIRHTAPYFHDNSAKTLEAVVAHYAAFFAFVSDGNIILTPQDQADIVAYMKLLD